MDFIVHDSTLKQNPASRAVFERLRLLTMENGRSGRCFYKYPLWDRARQYIPDIVLLDANYGLLAIDVKSLELRDIHAINETDWTIGGKTFEAPILALEDFVEEMDS